MLAHGNQTRSQRLLRPHLLTKRTPALRICQGPSPHPPQACPALPPRGWKAWGPVPPDTATVSQPQLPGVWGCHPAPQGQAPGSWPEESQARCAVPGTASRKRPLFPAGQLERGLWEALALPPSQEAAGGPAPSPRTGRRGLESGYAPSGPSLQDGGLRCATALPSPQGALANSYQAPHSPPRAPQHSHSQIAHPQGREARSPGEDTRMGKTLTLS